jgi:hypothetical protein
LWRDLVGKYLLDFAELAVPDQPCHTGSAVGGIRTVLAVVDWQLVSQGQPDACLYGATQEDRILLHPTASHRRDRAVGHGGAHRPPRLAGRFRRSSRHRPGPCLHAQDESLTRRPDWCQGCLRSLAQSGAHVAHMSPRQSRDAVSRGGCCTRQTGENPFGSFVFWCT